MEKAPASWIPTRSLVTALSLLAGVVLGQALACPALLPALALCGLGLALPTSWRYPVIALGLGLTLCWRTVAPGDLLPARIDVGRPLSLLVHQVGDWRLLDGRRHTRARLELLRQGATVIAWPVTVQLALPPGQRVAGSRWRLRGYLRRPAPLANGVPARRLPAWRVQVKSLRLIEVLPDRRPSAGLEALLRRWRGRTRQAVVRAAGLHPGGALARALVLGEATALPENWLRGLRRTGMAHVVALSGLHLGILAAWLVLLGRPLPRGWAAALVIVGTLLYLGLGGGRASLVRSWLMVAAAGAAALSGRSARSIHALAWTAAGLAALQPAAVQEVGFQLTFAASIGVILGSRWLPSRWPLLPRSVARALATTAGAQLATAPLALPVFHWLPLWAWAWNLALVPAVALAVPVSFIWVAAAVVWPAAASRAVSLLDALAGLISLPASLPAGWLGGIPWSAGAALSGLLACSVALVLARPRPAVLGLALLLVVGECGYRRALGETVVQFIDVGQGDAMLLRQEGAGLMVDGGGWRGPGVAERALLPTLGRAGIRELEVAIVSHGDGDHCRGLLELADYVPIREVWMAPGTALTPCGLQLALVPGIRVRPLWAGQEMTWRGWRFEVLNPLPGARGAGNEDSLVLRAQHGDRSLLLTGDIGHVTEHRILGRVAPGALRSTLLKVAHHGSSSSTSLSWLQAARPELAVISASRNNPFGHPAASVLSRLESQAIPVLRTDRSGQVEIRWPDVGRWRLATPGAPK
ncbi:MAG: DNA internalization-related competence protein ComEC/Rec2 [Acidobacteria bacterium]|nr:DNA internalization-related competence protein ComEC/Rec2 [Acidobacteriota bacterium]